MRAALSEYMEFVGAIDARMGAGDGQREPNVRHSPPAPRLKEAYIRPTM